MGKKKSKISSIIDSLKEKRFSYLKILTNTDKTILNIRTEAKGGELVTLLDKIFDLGYKVKKGNKKDFDK